MENPVRLDDTFTQEWRQQLATRLVLQPHEIPLGVSWIGKKGAGVYAPDYEDTTYDWRQPRKGPGNTKGVRAMFDVAAHARQLTKHWPMDAHCVAYVMGDEQGIFRKNPRVNKLGGGIEWVLSQGYWVRSWGVLVDIDNPDHKPWTPEARAAMEAKLAGSPLARSAFWYFTKNGLRLGQPFDRLVDVKDRRGGVEPIIHGYLQALEREGFVPDWKCVDWTRFFRMPYATREDDPTYVLTVPPELSHVARVDPELFRPVIVGVTNEPDEPTIIPYVRGATDAPPRPRAPRQRRAPRVAPARFDEPLPERWDRVARALGAACAREEHLHGRRHELFRDLAGALCKRYAPSHAVPSIVRLAAELSGSADPEHHRQSAVDTVVKWCAGETITGIDHVRGHSPAIASALERALNAEAHLANVETAKRAVKMMAREEVAEKMLDVFRFAGGAPVLLDAACGIGKSEQALRGARLRALTYAPDEAVEDAGGAAEDAGGGARPKKPPLRARTLISVPTHKLAKQLVARSVAGGLTPLRLYSQASYGTPEQGGCRYPTLARELARGGQSVLFKLCHGEMLPGRGCAFRDTCRAFQGQEGDPRSPLAIGAHAGLARGMAHVGRVGAVVIDEPSDVVVTETITLADLETTLETVTRYPEIVRERYRVAMLPALRAALAFVRAHADAARTDGVSPLELLGQGADAVTEDELLGAMLASQSNYLGGDTARTIQDCVAGAHPLEKHAAPPSIARAALERAKLDGAYAARIGTTSYVLGLLRAWLIAYAPAASVAGEEDPPALEEDRILRVEKRGGLVLACTRYDAEFRAALNNGNPLLLLDAGAEVHVAPVTAALGGPPRVLGFALEDGAPIERTQVEHKRATRRSWFDDDGVPRWSAGARRALRVLFDWATTDTACRRLGLVTFLPIAAALRLILDPADVEALRAWSARGFGADTLEQARAELGPLVAAWTAENRELRVGWYGGMRGLDDWGTLDAVATLGDPWAHAYDQLDEAEFLAAQGVVVDAEARWKLRAAIELEQALGRLRVIHRETPGRQLHLGGLRAHGVAWQGPDVLVRAMPGGPIGADGGWDRDKPPTAEQVEAMVVRLGGAKYAAMRLGCALASIYRYMSGDRVILRDVFERMQECVMNDEEGSMS